MELALALRSEALGVQCTAAVDRRGSPEKRAGGRFSSQAKVRLLKTCGSWYVGIILFVCTAALIESLRKGKKLRIERKKRKIVQCGVDWLHKVIPFTSFNDLRNLLQALLLTVLMATFTMAVPMEIAAKVLIN